MKICLVLSKTEFDEVGTPYPAIKTIDIVIPLEKRDGWNVIGAEWKEDNDAEGSNRANR